MTAKKQRRKVKRKIRFRQSARLVHKNDATRVDKPDTIGVRKAPFIMNDNGLNMRIKIKRKSR